MIFIGIYLLVGAIAFFWSLSRSKAEKDDILIPFLVLADPLGWIAWLLWPLALPLYQLELRERARLRIEGMNKGKHTEPERCSPLGAHATAVTKMCPTGIVEIGGQHREARSEDGLLDPGDHVVVVAERDSRLVVRRLSNQPELRNAGSRPSSGDSSHPKLHPRAARVADLNRSVEYEVPQLR